MKESEHRCPKVIGQVVIDGESLTIEQVAAVARSPKVKVELSPKAVKKIQESRDWVEEVARKGKPIVYGVNTAFGSKGSSVASAVSPEDTARLQRSLILSHSAGVGEPFPEEVVRATILLRANTLAKGYSGIRAEVIETLIEMLNRGVHPVIPQQGSVGASGDLAPLSHLALVLSTDAEDKEEDSGEAFLQGERMSGKKAMEKAGIERVVLAAKEGLALNNGCQVSSAVGCLALYDAENLYRNVQIAAAMSLEALRGCSDAFKEEIHLVRPHPGQKEAALHVRELLKGSQLIDSKVNHDSKLKKVQDSYSLRCIPQVHGAVLDVTNFVRGILAVEINSATDNPLIFPGLNRENKALSGGNFHGEYLAFAMDFLAIAVAELGNIAERRIFKLTNRHLNENLPPLLSQNNSFYSGLMIPQYTAAALVSENKSLAHPASVDSIPTCEDIEDHVSMAPIAARKARAVVKNVEKIVAIELLCAAQGVYFRRSGIEMANGEKLKVEPLEPGERVRKAYDVIREHVTPLAEDRVMYTEIEKVAELVRVARLVELCWPDDT